MKVRTYGLLLLCLVGIVPLGLYGYLAILRAQHTSIDRVREGNQYLASSIAWGIANHVQHQRDLLATMGIAVLHASDRALILDGLQLEPRYEHFYDIAVYELQGTTHAVTAGSVPADSSSLYAELAAQAIATGTSARSPIRHAADNTHFANLITVAEPLWVAGALRGAVVAQFDLVGIWSVIDAVRVGKTGFVRLMTSDGVLLAHGHPDERRAVFIHDPKRNRALLREVQTGARTITRLGRDVVAAAAAVPLPARPSLEWSVVIEQTATEAYAEIDTMKLNLALVGSGALGFAVFMGLVLGRRLVRALETLRAFARELAHDLSSRLTVRSRLVEVREVAAELNTMAVALVTERDAARARERLTTFARVAAGLAHDLRLPIEAVYGACQEVLDAPDDELARHLLHRVSQRDLPRLKRFVDDLQRLAKTGDIELERIPVSPMALLEEIAGEITGTPKWSGVTVEVRGNASTALLDRDLVRRALLNLASNAADACLEKGRNNCITLEAQDECLDGATLDRATEITGIAPLPGESGRPCPVMRVLALRVIDTGSGIPPERLQVLERGDFQSSKRVSGVGLGLGVVRQVVAAHRGGLVISSRIGEGSTFTMILPRDETARRGAP